MGFFDLNIPYVESPPSNATTHKNARVKIVIKAMELGYTGVAYNRTMKGVMSDRDRCSIPLLTLAALLKLAPSLSASVNFHRDLLGVPRCSPFRQYTRLTVFADTIAQCQVLNSGNPVLKTYDLVAVRPLNQSAFDHACEKAEVDIISINFAEKLPFRLKLPMIKAAIERGVYFELTYSDLILDVQLRRQMISNAKLLVDWTRGKNLILSSGASSVTELRGPYDVANLSSLLGISMERAKAAVSKNCRALISNALRKKHFHKETIRVEPISSGEQFDSKEPWSGDWLKWDPISSGEGDLQLDDMAESFTASTKVSKTVKTINFASVIDSIPSHSFRVNDLIYGTQAVSHSRDSGKSNLFVAGANEKSGASNGVSENRRRLDILHETDQNSLHNAPLNNQSSSCENNRELDSPSAFPETIINTEDVEPQPTIIEEDDVAEKSFTAKETERDDQNTKHGISSHAVDLVLSKEIAKCPALTSEIELGAACNVDNKLEGDTLPDTFHSSAHHNEESKTAESSDADFGSQNVAMGEVGMKIDIKDQEDASVALDNVSSTDNVIEREHFRELVDVVSGQNLLQGSHNEMDNKNGTSFANHETQMTMEELRDGERLREPGDGRLLADKISIQESCTEMIVKDDSSVANHEACEEVTVEKRKNGVQFREPGERLITGQNLFLDSSKDFSVKENSSDANQEGLDDAKMEEQIHGEADSETDRPTLVPCVSEKVRAKRRMQCRALLFPLKRMLNPLSFKRKARKFKHTITKM
ncbi:hypothetical protein AB3S75_039304 [Citrus x aurantiifolia]